MCLSSFLISLRFSREQETWIRERAKVQSNKSMGGSAEQCKPLQFGPYVTFLLTCLCKETLSWLQKTRLDFFARVDRGCLCLPRGGARAGEGAARAAKAVKTSTHRWSGRSLGNGVEPWEPLCRVSTWAAPGWGRGEEGEARVMGKIPLGSLSGFRVRFLLNPSRVAVFSDL